MPAADVTRTLSFVKSAIMHSCCLTVQSVFDQELSTFLESSAQSLQWHVQAQLPHCLHPTQAYLVFHPSSIWQKLTKSVVHDCER